MTSELVLRLTRRGAVLSLFVLLVVVPRSACRGIGRSLRPTAARSAGRCSIPSGAAWLDVEVEVRNVDTNYTRTTPPTMRAATRSGRVPLGTYDVTVTPANMAAVGAARVRRRSAPAPRQTSTWASPACASRWTSRAGAPRPSRRRRSRRRCSPTSQLRNLPAPGRRIKNLFLLTPATQIEPECGGFSVSGQKGVFTSFNVDGGDYTSSHFCGHVEMAPTFTVEALEELQVLRSTFSAEFGRSTGGIINLATKSGTNQFRGSGFYLFRNDALTKTRPVRPPAQIDRGNQFGGSIRRADRRKDRTFFFSAAEVQYNNKPVTGALRPARSARSCATPRARRHCWRSAPEGSLTAVSQLQSVVNRIDHRLDDDHNLVGAPRLHAQQDHATRSARSSTPTASAPTRSPTATSPTRRRPATAPT